MTQDRQNKSPREEIIDRIKEGAFIVDVRSPEEFSSGTAPGAVNIPVGQLNNYLSEFENRSSIILFCRSGSRSEFAKLILGAKGFKNVYNAGTWQGATRLIEEALGENS